MRAIVGAGAAAICALAAWWLRPSPVAAQKGRPGEAPMQFKVIVGLVDNAPKEWKGRIEVTGGTLAGIAGWRFSGADSVQQNGSFLFQTKIGNLENQLRSSAPYGETDWNDPAIRRLVPEGLILRARGSGSTRFSFASESGSFEFTASSVPYGSALWVLGGNGRVERLPLDEKLSEPVSADDEPAVAIAPNGDRWTAWLSYQDKGDYISVHDGSAVTRVTDKGDHHSPAIAVNPRGWVHVFWAQRDGEEFHIYQTTFAGGRWTTARRLTEPGSSNIHLRLASTPEGKMALVWQSLRQGQSQVRLRSFNGRDWTPETRLDEGPGNSWAPSVAFGGGKIWAAWDSYRTGAYQIYARAEGGETQRVTAGDRFSVRPSIAVREDGTPVVAWEESGPLWGKDYAFLVDRRGTSLYQDRKIRLAFLDSGQWTPLAADPVEAVHPDQRRFVQQPRIAWDASGRLHLLFRVRTSVATARMDHWASGGRWETFHTALDGEQWSLASLLPSSVGRNGMRGAMAFNGDLVHLVWPTDNRGWPPPGRYGDLEIHATRLAATGSASKLTKAPWPASAQPENPHPAESEDTARIRAHRIEIGGKSYRIVRGDLHRHTELSPDGAGDGSLDDLYRYALDAAAMDYAHVADHQMGSDEDYNWWITQKSNDLYFMPRRFVPLYGYERSVPYPNGHRNVIWAERGKPVLRINSAEQQGAVNTGSVLYPYLRDTGGVATSHTSATPQGTDWRDNDPALEPVVEIYQGFESNYETAGAPRAWKEGDRAIHNGLRPAGYVWNAWAKGYKLGVQASSDHVSTHTSYACILVEDFTRKGILDAIRKRHTYAATDSIVLDFRINGSALMGDAIATEATPKIAVKAIGTAPIKQIELVRNNAYIYKMAASGKEASFEYLDSGERPTESWYYVRVEQTDGQLAWSSPIWVSRQ